jgi:hypothetical protein
VSPDIGIETIEWNVSDELEISATGRTLCSCRALAQVGSSNPVGEVLVGSEVFGF